MKTTYLLTLLLFPVLVFCQHAQISKEKPNRGETITITYTPDSTSRFSSSDELYISVFCYMEDYATERTAEKMKNEGGKFTTSLNIKENASAYKISFRVKDVYDRKSALLVKPVSSQGTYYRNAFASEIMNSPTAYKEELENYPENYSVYRSRWQYFGFVKKDSAKILIQEELEGVIAEKADNDAYYYALTCGNIMLGDFDKARENFVYLIDKFPQSPLVADVYSFYQYNLFSQSVKDSLIEGIVYEHIVKYPETRLAKNNIRQLYNKKSVVKDPESLGKIAAYWMEKDPEDAMMYYHYARSLSTPADKLFYLNKASNILFNAELEAKKGYNKNGALEYNLPSLITGFEEVGAYAQALGMMHLLESYTPGIEGYVLMQKGRILNALERKEESIEAYLMANDRGFDQGKDSARLIFNQLSLGTDFEDYAFEIAKKSYYAEKVQPAPPFDAVDLDGNNIDLASLKGKVVVLNFWFIGCAPCRVEIPGLNEMVESYGDEVVFLAFALDAPENLREFLEEMPFEYTIIPDAHLLADQYTVSGYPTHIVIDKEGNVRSKLSGGSAQRHKQIMPLIDRILRF